MLTDFVDYATPQTIGVHPYAVDTPLEDWSLARNLVRSSNFGDIAKFGQRLIAEHAYEPFDLLVGEDVSGRVPTLIAHRLFRLAAAGGHVESVPETVFMASGQLDNYIPEKGKKRDKIETEWTRNLSAYAQRLVGTVPVNRVAIVTEIIGSGASVARLRKAFSDQRAEVVVFNADLWNLYLGHSRGCLTSRNAVGVEKNPPKATSHRRPDFNGSESAKLRLFLDDYSKALYARLFESDPVVQPENS